eukprot:snap_masked-scaffold_17-processed-gene-1.27-mRNA-1 protein AED:1.00 eAED:1.00 QI:0/-1/0/0/-1/1/1/0/281
MTEKEFPLLPITSSETIYKIKHYKILPTSKYLLLICSYPKSGTTWLQNIIFQLATRKTRTSLSHISDFSPFFESDKTFQNIRNLNKIHKNFRLEIFNTHLWPEMLPDGDHVKYIYITRSPEDVCLSFYKHLVNMKIKDGGFDGSLDEFVTDFLGGRAPFGSWDVHLNRWNRYRNKKNILFLNFESLKKNLENNLKDINHFCGFDELESEEMKNVLEKVSFKYMKKNVKTFEPKSVEWREKENDFQFVRNGKIGEGKEVLQEKWGKEFDKLKLRAKQESIET